MSNYLDRVEDQLSELTERGAHRRLRARRPAFGGAGAGGPRPPRPPRRRSEAVALLAAFAVAAAVVAIVLVNVHGATPHRAGAPAGRSTASRTTTTTHTATVPGKPVPGSISLPIPVHFAPQSFTATSELTWWLLGPAPECNFVGETPPCGAILHTTDGGRHFIAIPAPRSTLTSFPGGASTGYSQLRFADAKNGFAYGPGLYVTHDGARTWHAVNLGGFVTDLAISGDHAYAVLTSSTNQGASGRLMRAPVDGDAWSEVSAAGLVAGGLWVQGTDVIVQSGAGTGIGGDVLVSHDGGQSFSAHPAPSPGLPCEFAAPEPPVVWARCATGTESGVWRSTDFGARFSPVQGTRPGQPNSAVFAAASANAAVYGYQQLYRTADAGATWTPAGPSGVAQWTYLGFTDSTHGVALGYVGAVAPANQRLYYTTDGGQSYHLVPLP